MTVSFVRTFQENITSPYSLLVGPNGRRAFFASGSSTDGIDVTLTNAPVNPNSNSTSSQTLSAGGTPTAGIRLEGPHAIAISPDQKQVFFARADALIVYNFSNDTLTEVATFSAGDVDGLRGAA